MLFNQATESNISSNHRLSCVNLLQQASAIHSVTGFLKRYSESSLSFPLYGSLAFPKQILGFPQLPFFWTSSLGYLKWFTWKQNFILHRSSRIIPVKKWLATPIYKRWKGHLEGVKGLTVTSDKTTVIQVAGADPRSSGFRTSWSVWLEHQVSNEKCWLFRVYRGFYYPVM